MELGWKLRRLVRLAQRAKGSIAIRGWGGTLRRALRPRAEGNDAPAEVTVRAPAAGHAPRRILVIETMTPDPSRDSGSVRLSQIFTLLNSDGWQVDFLADDADASSADAARLGTLGVRVIREPALRWLAREGAALDAVMLCRLPVADQYIDVVRRFAPQARAVFDTVDLHFIREQRAAELTGNPALMRQARRSRDRELAMVARCDITLVVSDEERDVLAREAPESKVALLSNIHDAHGRRRGFVGRHGMLFVGGFGHPPNEDAVRWFIADVLPRVRSAVPHMRLHVVGDIDAIARRAIESDAVLVHGRVADLAPLHEQTLVSIAPLRFGAGVKGKVNQAMSHGLPVVLTTIAAEGMHLRDGVDALVADTPEAFAAAIVRLSSDERIWTAMSDASVENVRRHFSVDNARHALRHALGTTA
ncbi:glycosyltransferase involved in cell wall biosynthesis [Luteibacter sp. 621]|uniref:glycosyltransferase n=1 Tax=Luteibacter sp. 621 TaxID=3373916 RepID=UPI003D2299F0